MNTVEQIKAEIERRKEINHRLEFIGEFTEDICILDFINSLPKEPASENLKESGNEDWEEAYRNWVLGHNDGDVLYCKNAWKAAMNWQREQDEIEIDKAYKCADKVQYRKGWEDCKEQMIKDAVEGTAHPIDQEIWSDLDKFPDIEDGDKVKLIIIKEE